MHGPLYYSLYISFGNSFERPFDRQDAIFRLSWSHPYLMICMLKQAGMP